VGIDQRGFGHSEGRRGVVESSKICVEDQLSFIDKVDQAYGGKDVPKFIVGHSLGGLISLSILAE